MFDVYVQDTLISQRLDLVAVAGVNTAYVLEMVVEAVNAIKVELVPVKQNPLISAIEVLYEGPAAPVAPVAPVAPQPTAAPVAPVAPVAPQPTATPVALPEESFAFRMNVGSSANWVDPLGREWAADSISFGRQKTIDCNLDPIAKTNLDMLYCSMKWFNNNNSGPDPYLITVPVSTKGNFRVRLHFAETVSQRVCHVLMLRIVGFARTLYSHLFLCLYLLINSTSTRPFAVSST